MADDVDDDEEPLEDRMELIQGRAKNFIELLKNGDEIIITRVDDDIEVVESYRAEIERKHPKLFGHMLALEQQMSPGLFPYFLGLLAFAVFLIGLQLSWWEEALGEGLCGILNHWWFYITAPPSVLYLTSLVCTRWAAFAYWRGRAELVDKIAAEGLDRDGLVLMLRDDSTLEWGVYFLKLDRGPFPVR